MQNNGYIVGAIIAILIIAGGFFIFKGHQTAPGSVATTTDNGVATTTYDLGNGIQATGPVGQKIEIIDNTIPAPSLTDPIVISASLDADVQAALRTNEEKLIAEIKAEPKRVDLWLSLGVYRKMAGDYTGAVKAWTYVATAGPKSINYVAYGNLGGLYADFLKDYPKAEANFKAAIAISPTTVDYYRQLYYLYTGFYKTNTTAAADILAQGLKANPNNPDLLKLQADLKGRAQ